MFQNYIRKCTQKVLQVLDLAVTEMAALQQRVLTPDFVLAALLTQSDSEAVAILKSLLADFEGAIRTLVERIRRGYPATGGETSDTQILASREFGEVLRIAEEEARMLGDEFIGTGTLLIALFAQTIMGYTAYQTGVVIASGAAASVITMPMAGRLLSFVDARLLIGTGALVSGLGMLYASHLNMGASFWQIMLPRLLLGMGFSWIWVAANTVALAGVPKEKMGQASGLFNLSRNLGGARDYFSLGVDF